MQIFKVNEGIKQGETSGFGYGGILKDERKNSVKKDSVQISESALQMYQQMIEEMNENRDEQEQAAIDEAKIWEIFRRISAGDEVPPIDEKKLQEYNSEMYQTAKMTGMLAKNEEKKEHKALFEEEEQGEEQKTTEQQLAESGSVQITQAEGPSLSFH